MKNQIIEAFMHDYSTTIEETIVQEKMQHIDEVQDMITQLAEKQADEIFDGSWMSEALVEIGLDIIYDNIDEIVGEFEHLLNLD